MGQLPAPRRSDLLELGLKEPMKEQRSQSDRQGVPWRCLLVVPRGCDVPQDLMRCLYLRGFEVQTVDDGPSAMLELSRNTFLSLAVHKPSALADGRRLHGAVCRYHPEVLLWQHDPDASTRLSVWADPAVAPERGLEFRPPAPESVEHRPVPAAESSPSEPSSGPPEAEPVLTEAEPAARPPHSPMVEITDEELAMLLGRPFSGHEEQA